MNTAKVYVLSHRNCFDGIASAYCAWRVFGNRAIYIEVNYGEEFPKLQLSPNDSVFILDFCYPLDVLLKIRSLCRQVVVIDHHESSYLKFVEELTGSNTSLKFKLAKLFKSYFNKLCKDKGIDPPVFDMNYSGATLSRLHFMPNLFIPMALNYVTDRDLWRFRYPDTRAFIEGLKASGEVSNFEYWDSLINDRDVLDECISKGRLMIDYCNSIIKRYKKEDAYLLRTIDGHNVCIFNALIFYEEIAEMFYTDTSFDIDYTISYYVRNDGTIKLSFRNMKDTGIDLRPIAIKWGGNGHKHSCGASLSPENTQKFLKLIDVN